MKKKTKKEQPTINELTYSYDSLVGSKQFNEHYWAARAALDKNKRYTLSEARKVVSDYLNKKVVN